MNLKSQISNLKLIAAALCCLLLNNTPAAADELRLLDGTVITVDESWERNNEVWYRQGQVIRSIPASEVVRGKVVANTATSTPINSSLPKRISRRASRQIETLVNTTPIVTPAPDPNAKLITRIIFKDGLQLDADASWEMGERIGYRLGTIQAFIDKSDVAQVLKDYVPTHTPQPIKSAPSSLANYSTKHAGLDQLIAVNAARHSVDPLLIYLVMQQESGFNYRAISSAGARGLMQLMPGTARQLGVRNIHDPVENVEAGTRYLKNLLQRFGGDVNLALAGYNAGEGAVVRYGYRVPPYQETINYVRRISWAYQQYKK